MLKELLDVGVPIDSVDRYGGTALERAVWMNRTDVIRFLCESGADVNKRSGCLQSTALHTAAWQNHTDIIEVLLKHGASTNIKASLGRTPIDEARDRNNEAAVRLLERH